jgi:hypothetical protein
VTVIAYRQIGCIEAASGCRSEREAYGHPTYAGGLESDAVQARAGRRHVRWRGDDGLFIRHREAAQHDRAGAQFLTPRLALLGLSE